MQLPNVVCIHNNMLTLPCVELINYAVGHFFKHCGLYVSFCHLAAIIRMRSTIYMQMCNYQTCVSTKIAQEQLAMHSKSCLRYLAFFRRGIMQCMKV